MSTWRGTREPALERPDIRGWLRVALRGTAMGTLVFGGLAILLAVRLIEAPLCGPRRPATPHITRAVCRGALWILGLRVLQRGAPMRGIGAMVANHASWLDIFVLNARATLVFVSKAEVAGWPGIGWLARATGTMFIRRDPRDAAQQAAALEARLARGERLLFFPEGTSSDGQRVLPFKTTLFQAFFSDALRHAARIQPVSVSYFAPADRRADFYGWWGEMAFGAHLLAMLAAPGHGVVEVVFHPPVSVDAAPNRKTLAHLLEAAVRDGHRPTTT
ncbi:2-acyl-glycerophospho-ethanolamine acyltransferase [Roseivivax jejudonensis]|uniref:2-acyl-glycerophospho-ethanolamine acyltransferase n=1 Tax=Roseivivax jejudonensis TaxID=1529041 RepID=A0A1X6Z480_9RHOB|nr:lysophospholipid acyltransferase family protein [Roseivivax jejudonensis]SLN39544.1 2-acyl-glycerophospho-ethanolamine acyltransferase [Roseivivax jejudonensis]